MTFDDDDAAIGYACELVRTLRQRSGYDDPNLLMKIRDEYRSIVFSIPFLAACA
jgi:hypothetical protein